MKVTLKEKKELIKTLIANANHCTMLNKREVQVIKAIKKDILFLNSQEKQIIKLKNIRNEHSNINYSDFSAD